MAVSLKWITPDAERVIVDCARVSADPSKASGDDARLLRYLIKNAHWSPFEMANICFEVHTTRDIARQMIRHKSMAVQEFSQRYQDAGILGDGIEREARMQHPTNRQASTTCDDGELSAAWAAAQEAIWKQATTVYQNALKHGVAKEVARAVLPEGMTPSRLFLNAPIRSAIHFVQLRSGNGSQPEVVAIARELEAIMREHMPVVSAAAFDGGQHEASE